MKRRWAEEKVWLVNDRERLLLASRLLVANTFWSRFMGLMGLPSLPEGHCLILSPCNNIHSFFMRFPIDVIYLDKTFNVLRATRGLKPWHIDRPCLAARHVLELPAGSPMVESGRIEFEREEAYSGEDHQGNRSL